LVYLKGKGRVPNFGSRRKREKAREACSWKPFQAIRKEKHKGNYHLAQRRKGERRRKEFLAFIRDNGEGGREGSCLLQKKQRATSVETEGSGGLR